MQVMADKNGIKPSIKTLMCLAALSLAAFIPPAHAIETADKAETHQNPAQVPSTAFDKYVTSPIRRAYVSLAPKPSIKEPSDPLEPINRGFYAVNEQLDRYAVKPTISAYNSTVPLILRISVTNFFNNIDDFFSACNGLLQAKFDKAGQDFSRFAVNSSLGMLGLFDVASRLNLEHGDEDFGQTLGYWGLGQGPYLFLPLIGPTTFRDGTGSLVRVYLEPTGDISNSALRNSVFALSVIDERALAEDALGLADKASLDRYRFIRNAYLQRRYYLVYDGQPPDTEE